MKNIMLALLVWLGLTASSFAFSDIVGKEVIYQVGNTEFIGYMAYDQNIKGKRPGILVVHEWWGHNAYARKRADMLAKMGYTAFALDMYGSGMLAKHPKDAKKFMNALLGDVKEAEKRFGTALKLLQDHKTTKATQIGAIGYCMGGGIILHAARIGIDLKAVASFHGSLGGKVKAKLGAVKAPLLIMTGKDDPFVPAKQLEGFKKEMDQAKATYTIKVYEGAKHSFTNPDADKFGKKFKLPLAYSPKADKESWAEMTKFLAKYMPLKKGGAQKPAHKPSTFNAFGED